MGGYSHRPATIARRQPTGVKVISIVLGVLGAVFLIIGVAVLLYGTVGAFSGLGLFGVTILGGILLIVFSATLLATASGLWHLERWALVLSLLVIGSLLLFYGLSGRFISLTGVFFLVIFVYLIAVHREFL